MKKGDIVAFRVGIITSCFESREGKKRYEIERLDGGNFVIYERDSERVKPVSLLKGRDLTDYHAFMLGVTP